MRLWTVPIVALGVAVASLSDEPTERAMRMAFESSLAAQVQNVLDFVTETGGRQALARVREAGTDKFEITSFRKLDCQRGDKLGHVCGFEVEIGVRGGSMREVLTGRFYLRDDGLVFTQDA
jgi:hypothetical protein